MTEWYKISPVEATAGLNSDMRRGLTIPEVNSRREQYGPNELAERGGRTPLRILWEQFTATMVLILISAAVLSAALGEFKDAIAIGAIVVLFGLLGFLQEYRAEQAMAALKRLAVPQVRVVRDGTPITLSARELVPGDLVLLEAGNLVPADLRLVEAVNLRAQEAALTGESEPVEKESEGLGDADLPLGDRRNMVFMGTIITYGRGQALVTATGMRTELGKIASLLQGVANEQTPLQRRLDSLGKSLALAGLAMAVLISALGLLRGEPLRDMLLTAVSIAVAIVPEGLPAVVTITLALGAQRMLRRRALIRRLPAVETLGSVTVICSDKTGTLTENRMTVIALDVAGHQVDLTETLRSRTPLLEANQRPVIDRVSLATGSRPESLEWLLIGSTLCNDAILVPGHEAGSLHAIGDPTEGALLVAAAHDGYEKEPLQAVMPRVAEIPFDSERKRMTTIHALDLYQVTRNDSIPHLTAESFGLGQITHLAFTKGAVDGLLELSAAVWVNNRAEPINTEWMGRVQAANDNLSKRGMRVLGIAFRPLTSLPSKKELASVTNSVEQELVLIGLVGMIDPPRREVKDAVATCRRAGIRPVMITGDHPLTAVQIAKDLGITDSDRALTGAQLERMSEDDLFAVVDEISVYARVSPEHKLRIVSALQKRGHIVAMTGDGVNDAPALKRANIGVAMGITGTDVSKEAAEMVLQDDNFATIVSAIEEGRTIYDNLRKFIKFSVAGNIGKVLVMLLAPLLGKPLPLLPLQLLWLNLLTDGLLGLGLGMEPPEKNTMRRPPISPQAGIFSGGFGWHVVWVGGLIGALALGVGYGYWLADPQGPWQTMTFSTLAFAQFFQAVASRSTHESLFTLGIRSNPTGLGIAGLVFVLQMAVLYTPFLNQFFGTRPLSLPDLVLSLGLGLIVFVAIEAEKVFVRRKTG